MTCGIPAIGCHWQLACQCHLARNPTRDTGGQAASGTRAPSDFYTLQIAQLALLVERLGDRTDDLDVRATFDFPKYGRRNMQ